MASRLRRTLLTISAVAAFGCGEAREGPAPSVAAGAPRVVAAPALASAPASAAHTGFIGVVFPRSRSDVAARVGGRMAEVLVRQGDSVEAGAPLAVIDDAQYQEERAVAKALLRAARAAARQAEVARDEAEMQHGTMVRASDSVAPVEVKRAKFAQSRADAALQRARADVETQQRRLAQLDSTVADTRVLAPFAGEVALVYLDAGETVAPGQPVVRLLSSDAPWVRFAVPSAEASALAAGDRVSIEIESVAAPVAATVRQVAPELDPISQMVLAEAELELDDDTRAIRSGLAAWVRPTPRGVDDGLGPPALPAPAD